MSRDVKKGGRDIRWKEAEFVQGTGRHLSIVEENREVGGEVRVLSLGMGGN